MSGFILAKAGFPSLRGSGDFTPAVGRHSSGRTTELIGQLLIRLGRPFMQLSSRSQNSPILHAAQRVGANHAVKLTLLANQLRGIRMLLGYVSPGF